MAQSYDELSEEELMAAYAAGDRAAFQALFDRVSPTLLRALSHRLPRLEDAHDLLQHTFLQLHRARLDYTPGRPLRPWLFTIALNLKREYFRRRQRRPESLRAEIQDPDARIGARVTESRVRRAEVRAALEQLPKDQCEVIELHWFQGLSYREIAATVGATLSAVKVRAHRGYERLRILLKEAR